MANHKSALKAHSRSLKRAKFNGMVKSRVKTFFTKTSNLIKSGDYSNAKEVFRVAESEAMKAVSKGVFKVNTIARKVSKLAKKLQILET